MAGLFSSLMPRAMPAPATPPAVPTVNDAAVQVNARQEMKKRALAQGRASTYLTDPSTQMSPEPDQRRMALGGF